MLAVKADRPDIMDFLLQNGSSIESREVDGATPLMYTVWMGSVKACKVSLILELISVQRIGMVAEHSGGLSGVEMERLPPFFQSVPALEERMI